MSADLLSLAYAAGGLVQEGRSFVFPCPQCGYSRMSLWPGRPAQQTACWCRACGYRESALGLAMKLKNWTFSQAKQFFGLQGRVSNDARPKGWWRAPKTEENPRLTPPWRLRWQHMAMKFVQDCQVALRDSRAGLDAIFGRHIRLQIALEAGLGWSDKTCEVPAGPWGVAEGEQKTLWLHRGLVLPTRQSGRIWAVSIRRQGPCLGRRGRYRMLRGSQATKCFTLGISRNKTVVLCEGILDSVLAYQNGHGLVACAAVNGVSTQEAGLDPHLEAFAKAAKNVILVPDNDAGGHSFTKTMCKFLPQAKIVHPDERYKDLGDMQEAALRGELPLTQCLDAWIKREILERRWR